MTSLGQVLTVAAVLCVAGTAAVAPVIFVPGLTASVLEAKTDHAPLPSECQQIPFWERIWPISKSAFAKPSGFPCFLNKFFTFFDAEGQDYQNFPGVEMRTVEGILGIQAGLTQSYYYSKEGFRLRKTFFAAPYDWRKPSVAQAAYFANLQELVERVYNINNGTKVTLLAASFGPQYALAFLQQMSQTWKDKYIAWFLAESPVWSGAPVTMATYASGVNLASNPDEAKFLRYIASTTDSLMWIFPRPGDDPSSYTREEIILQTPSKNYTAYDAAQMLVDLGMDYRVPSLQYLQNEEPVLTKFEAPGVDTIVTYGYGVNTGVAFTYDQDFVKNASYLGPLPVSVVNASGDLFVPVRSSQRSYVWANDQAKLGKKLIHLSFANQVHAGCFFPDNNDNCFQQIIALLTNGTVPAEHDPARPHSERLAQEEQILSDGQDSPSFKALLKLRGHAGLFPVVLEEDFRLP